MTRTRTITREILLGALAELIASRRPGHAVRVAIDGPDAAGKTTLADELGARLGLLRDVIRTGIDHFHRPRKVRTRRGELSPEGYYHDAFDYWSVRRDVLEPLGPGGDQRYRPAAFDHHRDAPVDAPPRTAPPAAVLLFDGVFLMRPELRDLWDLRVLLDISPEETLRRALVRDARLMGGTEAVNDRYRSRYLPAQGIYREEERPDKAADIVIDNSDPGRPRILKWPGN